MEYLTIILLGFSLLAFIVQYSLIEKKVPLAVALVVFAIIIYFMHHWAIEQSLATFQNILSNKSLLVDLVVIQTIEAVLGILSSIALIRQMMGDHVNKWIGILKFFPGVVVFITLFYGESYLFILIRTDTFSQLAIAIAVIFGLSTAFLIYVLRKVLHEYDLRCEIKFLLHIIQVIIGSTLYIIIAGLPVNQMLDYASLIDLGVITLVVLIAILTGYLFYHFKMKRMTKY